MKNIYLIETKEPTANILLVKDNGEIQIFDKSFYDMWKFHQQFGDFAPSNAVYKNIYITSSIQKIILTTDPILIADGVQPIDDEFLQWFVQNPNCEEVEVERCPIEGRYSIDLRKYIQKEEPKHETLEEAAIEYSKMYFSENKKAELGFIAGTKWQAERSFTLEQIDKLFFNENGIGYFDEYLNYKINDGKTFIQITFKEWFNTFKKK